MDQLAINLIVMVVFGAIVSAIAHSRGRTPIGWFLIGFLAPCLGLILVLVLPDLKIEEQRRDRLRRDNQRLREQVRKDRQVSDQRHATTAGRLGAHDAVLGLDTRGEDEGGTPPQLRSKAPRSNSSIDPESRWHYALSDDSGTQGPISFDELRAVWADGALSEDSLLWTKGMDDWLPMTDLPDVEDELRNG